jgi:hypothetical protein
MAATKVKALTFAGTERCKDVQFQYYDARYIVLKILIYQFSVPLKVREVIFARQKAALIQSSCSLSIVTCDEFSLKAVVILIGQRRSKSYINTFDLIRR